MNIKNKEKVLKKLKSPSKSKLNSYERVGLTTGGALMAIAGIGILKNRSWPLILMGSVMTIIGVMGKNPLRRVNKKTRKPLKVKASVVINRDRREVYDFWRVLENLPTFMEHIKEVETLSETRSRWKANMHTVDVGWEAEITEDKPGEVIGWRSLPGSDVRTSGKVQFRKAAGNRGTVLTILLKYADDTGRLAKGFASLYRPVFSQQVKEELRKCKKILEAREVAKIKPEPHASV